MGTPYIRPKFNLQSLLLVSIAAPIWIFLIITLPQSPGFGGSPIRYAIPPLVLTGITFAIHRLIRKLPNPWPLSILIAPLLAMTALHTASALAG